jgi:hypothetical protein
MKFVKLFYTVIIGVATIAAAVYAYQGVTIQKNQIERESSPFFKYRYSESDQSFLIESEDDVSIHSIQWFFPYLDIGSFTHTKNSNLIKIDEIFFILRDALLLNDILIPPPDNHKNSYGYLRCELLPAFDYPSEIDTNPGFPVAVIIEYTRKGEAARRIYDLLSLTEFEDLKPQIRSINQSNNDVSSLNTYMKNGYERLQKILDIYRYDENKIYVDEDNKCTSGTKTFYIHFFNKEDKEEWNRRHQ